ncbi:MAG: hypothetical protein GY765_27375, partial [bacterium]|nr:hypothetical protein [bacterium]
KDIDYVEIKAVAPHKEGIPPKLLKIAERLKERSGITLKKFTSRKELMGYSETLFHLVDETFDELYGTVPLTEAQIQYYVKKYMSFVDPELIQAAFNKEGEMIGFMIALPSLSRAFQKARGRLFPFGWYHLMRSFKTTNILDFYLAGIKEKYRGLGVDLMMVLRTVEVAMRKGIEFSESNPELETNKKIQGQWKYFNPTLHKKRRIYKKSIG